MASNSPSSRITNLALHETPIIQHHFRKKRQHVRRKICEARPPRHTYGPSITHSTDALPLTLMLDQTPAALPLTTIRDHDHETLQGERGKPKSFSCIDARFETLCDPPKSVRPFGVSCSAIPTLHRDRHRK